MTVVRDQFANYRTFLPAEMPMMKKIRHITRKRKNKNFAIPAAVALFAWWKAS